ncbi:MAG: DNA ligase [Arcobacter sp.]|nr:DNA ligase [Arcobacter sp.]
MKIIILLFIYVFSFAIEVQKPKTYKGDENISTWVMSEKLDGIRAVWTGKELVSKKGNKIYAPKWFTVNFPNFKLDGELWTKRDDFENIQNIVMDKKPSIKWNKITYNIFEVPNSKGDFFKRLEKAKIYFKKNDTRYVKIIDQIKIKDKNHLDNFLENIVLKKGEGVIIKDPFKSYHTGRSPHILKVKKVYDMEGSVIAINISKKTNKLKSLTLKLKNGVVFNLGGGFSKKQRDKSFKKGDIVTFKYYGFTKYGKPKFASFLRLRKEFKKE